MSWSNIKLASTTQLGLKAMTLKCSECHGSLLLKHLSDSQGAILLGGVWYCGATCFCVAAERLISTLLRSGAAPANHVSRMPLGLILLSRGLLTAEQLRLAADELRLSGEDIGEILVTRGYVTEKQVTGARATQWGCPVFTAGKQREAAWAPFPTALMQLYSMTPLHFVSSTNILLLGFLNNIEHGAILAIEQMTGCRVKPCFVTPADFTLQMQQTMREREDGGPGASVEVEYDQVFTSAQIAAELSNKFLDSHANEVAIALCKEHIWARLGNGTRQLHLFFRVTR